MSFDRAHNEVVRLHDFFAAWFRGELPDEALEPSLADVLHKDFEIVPPSGLTLDRRTTIDAIRSAKGSNSEIKILIEQPRLLGAWPGLLLFQYVEVQLERRGSEAENRRLATVLFEQQNENLLWRYLTEV